MANEPEAEGKSPATGLSDAYRKVHKSYAMVSGLLASWSLIGITIETKEKWGFTLKSPNGIPLILGALVLYFGYRLVIEWVQIEATARANWAARLDYRISHSIALIALAIPTVQFVIRRQIVDVVLKYTEGPLAVIRNVLVTVVAIFIFVGIFLRQAERHKFDKYRDKLILKLSEFHDRHPTWAAIIWWALVLCAAGYGIYIVLRDFFKLQR